MASEISLYTPASVMDIVTFGFKRLFRNIKPLALMASPFIVVGAALTSAIMVLLLRNGGEAFLGFMELPATVLMLYFGYGVWRYLVDNFSNQVKENPFYYLMPSRTLLGMVLLYLVAFAAIIPIYGLFVVLGIVAALFIVKAPALTGIFILLGLAIFVPVYLGIIYLVVRFGLTVPAYMANHEVGIIGAYKESWRLTKGNFWRSLGLFLLLVMVVNLILAPFTFIPQMFISLMISLQPSFVQTPTFAALSFVLFIVSLSARIIISSSGMQFVLFRYYFDLAARKDPHAIASPGVATAMWTPGGAENG